jgi:S-DNA-T family DNA segregation ATPase FtsK/SpoIIIE
LMRMGPALGIWVIMATQTVRDSTIPTEAQAVAVYRYGLKMESHEPNDKVLGTGAHRAGTTATIFGFEEKGIGWFKGEGAKPFIARSVVGLDAVAARTIAVRARAWRAARGLLTGEADEDGGIEDAEIVISIEQDIEQVLRQGGVDRAQYPELVDWLRDLRPEHYADLTVDGLAGQLRKVPHSRDLTEDDEARIVRDQVWSNGKNGRGVKLVDLGKRAGG